MSVVNKEKHHIQNEKYWLLALMLIVFLVNMSISVWVRSICIFPDEANIVATTAFFAGEKWAVQKSHYYGYGEALLYVPIFFLTKTPALRYLLMGIINSALVSTIPLMAYYVLKQFQILTAKKCWIYALMISLFPTYIAATKWMWSETLLCVLPWALLCLCMKLLDERANKKVWSALLGFALVFGYAAHGRGITYFVVIAFLILYWAIICKKKVIHIPSFAVSVGIFYLIHSKLTQYVTENLYERDASRMRNTFANTLSRAMDGLASMGPAQFFQVVRMAACHFLVSIVSSYGFLLIFIGAVIFYFYNKAIRKSISGKLCQGNSAVKLETFAFFAILSYLGAVALGLVQFYGSKGTYLIYTRYYAPSLAVIVLGGMLILYETNYIRKWLFHTIVCFFFCILFLINAFRGGGAINSTVSAYLNIYPYLINRFKGADDSLHIVFIASIIVFGLFLVIALLARFKPKWWSMLVTAAVFLEAGYYCAFSYVVPRSNQYLNSFRPVIDILTPTELAAENCSKLYSFKERNMILQFYLPDYTVASLSNTEEVLSDISSLEENSLICSAEELDLDFIYEDVYRVADDQLSSAGQYLWIYGGELASIFEKDYGILVENNFGGA